MRKLNAGPVMVQGSSSVAKPGKRGRKRHITLEVVERVGDAFARGVPLKLALALERNGRINEKSWQKALSRNPEFVGAWEGKKADFYLRAIRRLEEAEELSNLRWLLERRFPGDFAKQPESQTNISVTVAGISAVDLERAREKAAKL